MTAHTKPVAPVVPCLGCASDAQQTECGVATINAFMSAVCVFSVDPRAVGFYLGAFCEKHRQIAAVVIRATAQANGRTSAELMATIDHAVRGVS